MLLHRHYPRIALAIAVASALASCDKAFFVEPAAAPATAAVSYALASAMDAGVAFDKADRVRVRVNGHGVAIDTILAFTPEGEARVRLAVDVTDSASTFAVDVEIRRATDVLFHGTATVRLAPGETTPVAIPLTPVAAAIDLPATVPGLTSLGDTIRLNGAVTFATGDVLPGQTLTYSSSDTTVATVSSTGRVTATGEGSAQIRATAGDLNRGVTVNVTFPALVRVCSTAGTAPTYGTVAVAVRGVTSGGVVRVCGGAHQMTEQVITKPLTIEPEAGANVTFNGGGTDFGFIVEHQAGTVIFRDLSFTGYAEAAIVGVAGNYHDVLIEGSTFSMAGFARGVFFETDNPDNAHVIVRDVDMSGGELGVFISGPVTVDVLDSRINGQSFANIQFQTGTNGTIARNTTTECGAQGCIRVRGAGTLQIEDNIIRTTMRVPEFPNGVQFGLSAGGTSVQVEGNLIEGIGTPNIVDRNTFPIRNVGLLVVSLGGATANVALTGNTIRNAATAIGANSTQGPVNVVGVDNIVQTANALVGAAVFSAGSVFDLHRNDFINYLNAINIPIDGSPLAPGSLTCNWWDSTNGPRQVVAQPVPAAVYTPWATAPIAGTGRIC